jgi:hypothetical protein
MNILEYNDNNYREKQEQKERDKFAIEFAIWMSNNMVNLDTSYTREHFEELLNEFKEEKGL